MTPVGSDPRARLFVALDLAAESREALAALPVPDGMRPLPPESLHLTLLFLGSRPEAEIPSILGALPETDARFTFRPAGMRKLRHLVAMGLESDEKADALQSRVAEALAAFHRPESRPWWPHITLARGRGVDAPSPKSIPSSITTESMTLYRSHPNSRYEAL